MCISQKLFSNIRVITNLTEKLFISVIIFIIKLIIKKIYFIPYKIIAYVSC